MPRLLFLTKRWLCLGKMQSKYYYTVWKKNYGHLTWGLLKGYAWQKHIRVEWTVNWPGRRVESVKAKEVEEELPGEERWGEGVGMQL